MLKLSSLNVLVLLLLLISCTPSSPSLSEGQVALEAIFEKDWDYSLKENPLRATSVGVHEYNALLPSAKLEDFERRLAFKEGLLNDLQQIDSSQLSASDRINFQLFKFQQQNAVAQLKAQSYLMPINAEGGFYTSFPFMVDRMPYKTPEDYENYLSRLEAFPKYTEEHIQLMKKGIALGYVPPRVILRGYESGVSQHRDASLEESVFYRPFKKFPSSFGEAEIGELRNKAERIIRDSVQATYAKFGQFMEEIYVPAARETVGASELPNGKAWYEQRVRFFTTLPYSSDEIFDIGQMEVRRIRREMDSVMRSTGFTGDFAAFLQFLRTDPQFYAKSPRELLMNASYFAKRIDGRLPKFFHPIPRSPYGVEPVPDAIAPKYTGGRYVPGSYENHRSGTYWVNTYKLESRPLYVLPALTLHEAMPGHHLQNAITEELEEVPIFRRNTYLSCYGEGWALYCELLGKEMGIYETPYQEFGRMTYEMWRACRLVVDVGLHAKGWSRQQAIDFLASNTALSLHEVTTEIDRYIGWPAQALSYKVGELKIRELRKLAEEDLGSAFDLREFHRVILSEGSVPLFILEEMVENYIEEKLRTPASI